MQMYQKTLTWTRLVLHSYIIIFFLEFWVGILVLMSTLSLSWSRDMCRMPLFPYFQQFWATFYALEYDCMYESIWGRYKACIWVMWFRVEIWLLYFKQFGLDFMLDLCDSWFESCDRLATIAKFSILRGISLRLMCFRYIATFSTK